jgi:hypothetical protein
MKNRIIGIIVFIIVMIGFVIYTFYLMPIEKLCECFEERVFPDNWVRAKMKGLRKSIALDCTNICNQVYEKTGQNGRKTGIPP